MSDSKKIPEGQAKSKEEVSKEEISKEDLGSVGGGRASMFGMPSTIVRENGKK